MILLALGYLEAAIQLLGQDKTCHQVSQSYIPEAHSAVCARTDFLGDSVAASDNDLQRTSALVNVRHQVFRQFLG